MWQSPHTSHERIPDVGGWELPCWGRTDHMTWMRQHWAPILFARGLPDLHACLFLGRNHKLHQIYCLKDQKCLWIQTSVCCSTSNVLVLSWQMTIHGLTTHHLWGNFPRRRCYIYQTSRLLVRACFGSTYTKIGTIQRRLAWPLRKDDTQIREAFLIFERFLIVKLN